MDLRNLPEQLSSVQRINQRRRLVEHELGIDLSATEILEKAVGDSEKRNCEQMFGAVPVPVGYAGPLSVTFSNRSKAEIHLPLATTEGALVASVNRGCKALSAESVIIVRSVHHGITRSIAFAPATKTTNIQQIVDVIRTQEKIWKQASEATSGHLKVQGFDLDLGKQYVFLTVAFDTDEAMGMNMATIAAQAIGEAITKILPGAKCVTVAGNIDSDKKPSRRTHERGRGYEVVCTAHLSKATIVDVLKTTPQAMLEVADAKLKVGSMLAGAIGSNLHVANIIAALYIATGQDIAHTVEGSLSDTTVLARGDGLDIEVRLPAIIIGVRGGGTDLPAQSECLKLLLKPNTNLHRKLQLAESVAAAVMAGEISLLAAQASGSLADAHQALAR